MKELIDHYKISGPKELEKYLKDLNKTSATALVNSHLRVYYSPKFIKRLCGVLFYSRIVVLYFHSINDIDDVEAGVADHFVHMWMMYL